MSWGLEHIERIRKGRLAAREAAARGWQMWLVFAVGVANIIVTLAVAWSLAHDYVGATIIGATSVDQLDDSLRAADVTLKPDVLAACDAVTREILYPMG